MVRTPIDIISTPHPGTRFAICGSIETPAEQIVRLTAEVASLEAELAIQKGIVAALLRRIYGPGSERMDHAQLLMEFLGEESGMPAAAPADPEPAADIPAKPRARRSNKLSDSLRGLPTVTREIIHPDVLAAPDEFRLLGEETSERLHVKPSAFTLEIIKRLTHVRKDEVDAVPVTAPLAPCLLPGSVLTPSLGAYLLTQKFCYHSTFYREEWKLRAAHGIVLTRNLMCSWHDHLADRLLPLHQLIAEHMRTSGYIRVDETPVRCLEPGSGKTAPGYFWVYSHDEHGVLFDWHKSRANTCLDDILIGKDGDTPFRGHLQSDGLRAYRTFIERHPDLAITPVSCLAHIARKFKETRGEFPRIGARVLLLIGELYQVERRLDGMNAHPLDRQRARWLESRKPYDHFRKLVRRVIRFRGITPGSGFSKALHYAIEQLPHLEPCFLDGRIRFDNNRTENAIRPTKLGHKNWMFIGGEHTGWRSAVIYTFVEQVRRHGADPFAYLEWVFEKLMHDPPPEQLGALLPCEWIKSRPSALQTAEARIA